MIQGKLLGGLYQNTNTYSLHCTNGCSCRNNSSIYRRNGCISADVLSYHTCGSYLHCGPQFKILDNWYNPLDG